MTIECTVIPQFHDDSPLGKLSQKQIVEYFDKQFERFPDKIHIIFTESLLHSSILNDFLNCPYDMEYSLDTFKDVLSQLDYELLDEEFFYDIINNNRIYINNFILHNYELWKRHKNKYKNKYFVFPVPNNEINREIEDRYTQIFNSVEKIIGKRLTFDDASKLDINISTLNYQHNYSKIMIQNYIRDMFKGINDKQVEDLEQLFLDYRIVFDTREDAVVEQIIKTIYNVQRHCKLNNYDKIKVYLVFGTYHDFEYYNDFTDKIRFKRKDLLSEFFCKRRKSCDINVRTSIYNSYEYNLWKTKQT